MLVYPPKLEVYSMSVFGKRNEQEGPRPAGPTGAPPRPSGQMAAPPQPAMAPPQPVRTAPSPGPSSVTNLGRSVSIKGEIRAQEDLVIDGQMEGVLGLGQNRL